MPTNARTKAFTLPELLVAGVLTASFFTAAAMIYQNITANRNHLRSYQEVVFSSSATLNNYYGLAQDRIFAYGSPSYGRAAMAELIRDRFWEDVERASAVFCLSRSTTENAVHPTEVLLDITVHGTVIDSHEKFLQLLINTDPNAATTFASFRNVPPNTSGTVFIIQPNTQDDRLNVRAIYDIDLVTPVAPSGVYASVRRYVGTQLTNYYDVFYEEASQAGFGPLFIAFEKRARLNLSEVDADPFKKARDMPFFFMWWPDPALPIRGETAGAAIPPGDPREAYGNMGVRTSLFFTVPMFPTLL